MNANYWDRGRTKRGECPSVEEEDSKAKKGTDDDEQVRVQELTISLSLSLSAWPLWCARAQTIGTLRLAHVLAKVSYALALAIALWAPCGPHTGIHCIQKRRGL